MHFCSHFLNRFKKKAVENKQKKQKEKKKTGKETSFLFLCFPSWRLNKNSFIWLGQIIYLCYYKVLNQGFVRSHNWSFRSVSPQRDALRRFKTLIQIKVLINTVFRRLYWYFSIALKVILSFPIVTKFSPVIEYELKFVKMQLLVKSISPWQQWTKNVENDKIRILRDVDLLLKISHQEL